jgi:DNA-directed RNA polymerase subunit RPC12/RpoP
MTPELNCIDCGGNRFRYPQSIHDETPIVCEECGHVVGTFAELKEKMTAAVLEQRR